METMMGYIEESAAQCRRNIEQASQLVQPAVDLYTKKEYNRILIIASGSSYNGSCLAKYFVEKVLKVRTEVVTSFTLIIMKRSLMKRRLSSAQGRAAVRPTPTTPCRKPAIMA